MKLLKMKPDSDQPMIALKLTDVARQENMMPKPVHKPAKLKRPAAAPPPVGIRRPAAVAASASPPWRSAGNGSGSTASWHRVSACNSVSHLEVSKQLDLSAPVVECIVACCTCRLKQ